MFNVIHSFEINYLSLAADHMDEDSSHPRITWMKTVLNDLESHNEAVNMAHNHPLWRSLAASGVE